LRSSGVYTADRDLETESKFSKKRTQSQSHFLFLAAEVCVVFINVISYSHILMNFGCIDRSGSSNRIRILKMKTVWRWIWCQANTLTSAKFLTYYTGIQDFWGLEVCNGFGGWGALSPKIASVFVHLVRLTISRYRVYVLQFFAKY